MVDTYKMPQSNRDFLCVYLLYEKILSLPDPKIPVSSIMTMDIEDHAVKVLIGGIFVMLVTNLVVWSQVVFLIF